jgi:uncharacterized PurR-regulated membrane protein YhhQ (DUF165 family)
MLLCYDFVIAIIENNMNLNIQKPFTCQVTVTVSISWANFMGDVFFLRIDCVK